MRQSIHLLSIKGAGMTALTLLFLTTFPSFGVCQNSQIKIIFTSESSSLQFGSATRLGWQVAGAESVFISGVGKVPTEGTATIRPERTADYILVAEKQGVRSSASIHIKVEGGRGDDDFPSNVDRFRYPIDFTRNITSIPNQLGLIHTVLQDEMKFTVKEYQTDEGFFFLTNSSPRDYLLDSSDSRIRARFISYLVKTRPQNTSNKQVSIQISLLIEYIRGAESTRRTESDDALYHREAERLRKAIESAN